MDPSRKTVSIDPDQLRALADVLDGRRMLEELAPWPGAEILSEIYLSLSEASLVEIGERTVTVERLRATPWITAGAREAFISVWETPEPISSPDSRIVVACEQLADWASQRRLPHTQLCFAGVSSLWGPEDFQRMYLVGRLARDMAMWSVAQPWFQHLISVASQISDTAMQTIGLIARGNTYYAQGSYEGARRSHLTARRLARRYGHKEFEGRALHDLCTVAVEQGRFKRAENYARAAFDAYGPRHPNIPRLAHDVANFWIDQGNCECAASVLHALLPFFSETPAQKIRILANLARAVAGYGDDDYFHSLAAQVRSLAEKLDSFVPAAFSLVRLAEGAVILGDWELAWHVATDALRVARERDECDVVVRAQSVLSQISTHFRGTPLDTIPIPSPGQESSLAFAERLISSLMVDDLIRDANTQTGASTLVRYTRPVSAPSLAASPQAGGFHSTFARESWVGHVVEYVTFLTHRETTEGARWEQTLHFNGEGTSSFNRATRSDVPPPHVHDPSVPGGVRAARPDEIPRRPW